MEYKQFKDNIELSRLGMGNMRLPVIDDIPGNPIDYSRAQEMIDYCMAEGINYYDTAYIYHGGNSERFLGKALKKYPRESYYLADKYNLQAQPNYKVQFEEQLKRLETDYIDFYLLHAVSDDTVDEYLSNGCIEYFLNQKELGNIKYLGFSFHGNVDAFKKTVNHHHWDFAQVQLNYYDWQYGTAKIEYDILTENNIPVMVMEPIHGGMLSNLTEESNKMLNELEPNMSISSWALRFVMSLENVFVILSGMSNMIHVKDNIKTFNENKKLSALDYETLMKANELLHESIAVTCTSCRYCCDDCPMQLNIPNLLGTYNEYKLGGAWRLSRLDALDEDKRPTACINCGACIAHCPQNIQIPDLLNEMAEAYHKIK